MNLTKMFKIQKELDERIVKEKDLKGVDLLDKKILSLQVELGELANELPEVFKFWSNKKNNYKKALEEYCDCLHFILSIGLEKWNGYDYELKSVRERFLTDQFNWLFRKVGDFSQYPTKGNYFWIINIFVGLGEMLGFTWEQIEQAYYQKNEINHLRQAQGY